MVSSVTSSHAVDHALVSRAAASVPLVAEAQAFLNAPSSAKQRDSDIPSPLEVVQSTTSPVDGRTLLAAQESSDRNSRDAQQQSFQQFQEQASKSANNNQFSNSTQSDPEQSADRAANPEGDSKGNEPQSTPANPQGLTEEELQQVQKLKQIDRQVRAHERSHQNAAPELTGPANFKTVRGPDGKLYAVAGEVSIDTGEAATPEATIQKLKRVIKAALAPLEPSPQDRKVAAQARAEIAEARGEIRQENAEEKREAQEVKQEAQEERQAQSQNEASGISTASVQPDITNAIQAFQAAAALGSSVPSRANAISV